MIDILNQFFLPEISHNILKFCIHPTAELIKPLVCQKCYKRKLKCYKCNVPMCFTCEPCGSITSCMYCAKCFEFYKQLLNESNLIVINNITHIININV